MNSWKPGEPPQPGRSGIGGGGGVPFPTPGLVPAADLPTSVEARRQAAGKLQGPSGLTGAGRDTAAAARQNAEDDAEHEDMQTEEDTAMDTGFIGILEPSAEDFMSDLLLQHLGSSGRSYLRENRASCRMIVSEMYSPPRVTAELRRMKHRHLMPGFALDLTVVDPDDGLPWDFSKSGKREKITEAPQEPEALYADWVT